MHTNTAVLSQDLHRSSSSSWVPKLSPQHKSKLLYAWRCQSVRLGVELTLGFVTRYYFLLECCCLIVAVLFLWGALSDERTRLQFEVQSLNGQSRSEPVTILYCLIWDSHNLKSHVLVFISPWIRVAQLYPPALGSLYVASCDSQGYGGGILIVPKPGVWGRPTETRQQISDRFNIWSQVPQWARRQDVQTDRQS
jgi:hypothetical protein